MIGIGRKAPNFELRTLKSQFPNFRVGRQESMVKHLTSEFRVQCSTFGVRQQPFEAFLEG